MKTTFGWVIRLGIGLGYVCVGFLMMNKKNMPDFGQMMGIPATQWLGALAVAYGFFRIYRALKMRNQPAEDED
jgi:Na+-transporting methylmalonyl-CoA/oxaloacetate decarboxylase beta subunit